LTIAKLNSELHKLKHEREQLQKENLELRNRLNAENNGSIDVDIISKVIKETINGLPKNRVPKPLIKKFNKKRRSITMNRIQYLAQQKNLSLSEIKDIIVDQEELCSKATFYRYIDNMKKKDMIDFVKIDDEKIVIKI
jgi:predicted nuclease with TOPRIM domain